jgi:hypothetical protein
VSIFNALYTLLTLLFLFLSYPLNNLISPSCADFSDSVATSLSPPLAWHLKFIFPHPHPVPAPEEFSAAALVTVHLTSPLFAVPVGAMAAIVAFVWLYTEVLLGDKNDEAGCEYRSFLFVKQRWENFVLASLRPKELPDNGDSFKSG